MTSELRPTAVSKLDRPQFRLRSLFSAVFWIAILFAVTTQAPWQLAPAIVLIWLATAMLYQAILGRMNRGRASIAVLVALASAVPFGIAGLSGIDPADPHPVMPIAIGATGWQKADPIEGHRTVRSQMIDDLLQRYNFRGWSADEVIELLGLPDRHPPSMRSVDMVYRLGFRPDAWALDDEYLYFRFDGQARVAEYGVTVD